MCKTCSNVFLLICNQNQLPEKSFLPVLPSIFLLWAKEGCKFSHIWGKSFSKVCGTFEESVWPRDPSLEFSGICLHLIVCKDNREPEKHKCSFKGRNFKTLKGPCSFILTKWSTKSLKDRNYGDWITCIMIVIPKNFKFVRKVWN